MDAVRLVQMRVEAVGGGKGEGDGLTAVEVATGGRVARRLGAVRPCRGRGGNWAVEEVDRVVGWAGTVIAVVKAMRERLL